MIRFLSSFARKHSLTISIIWLPRNEFWIIPIYTAFSGDKNFKRQKRASGINGELMITFIEPEGRNFHQWFK